MTLTCPSGTKFKKLVDYGLQKANPGENDNNCPLENDAGDQIKVDLDEECSLAGFKKKHPAFFKKMTTQFLMKCDGQGHCYFDISRKDWPESC